MNEAVRPRWDDDRREQATGAGQASDALAELARLVAQDDPYRNVFRPAPASRDEDAWRADSAGRTGPAPLQDHSHPDDHAAAGPPEDRHGIAERPNPEPLHDPVVGSFWAEHEGGDPPGQGYVDEERYYATEAAAHLDDAGIADAGLAIDAAEAVIPDLWASGGTAPVIDQSRGPAPGRAVEDGSARRPLLVLGAVLLLTGGGLAASFLAKQGTTAAVGKPTGNGAPTILAAAGPTKIKQDDPSTTAPEDKDAALLNKGAGATGGAAKIVQTEEQPADLSQLPKSDNGAALGQPSFPSPFPDAKKVKTFVVHPDGTPLYDDGQAIAEAAPPFQQVAPGPVPQASTPKALAGTGVTTPPSATIASLAAGLPPSEDAAPKPTPTAPKPARATPTEKAAGAGGFGLQLAASPSEAEAHAAFAKLKRKYPAELGSLSASVHQSETGGKPVYRVRVGGMTHEAANALCSKLMAGGGSCFVVRD